MRIAGRPKRDLDTATTEADVRGNRWYVIAIGVVAVVLAAPIQDIISPLTIAYDILADEPAHIGPTTATVVFVAVGLPTPRTPVSVLSVWEARTAGQTKTVPQPVSG